MNTRITRLIALGAFTLLVAQEVAKQLVWAQRIESSAELRQRSWREIEASQAKEKAQYVSSLKEELAHETDPERKVYLEFLLRDSKAGFLDQLERVRVAGEVSRYDAWLLGRAYFFAHYGLCGSVGPPTRDGALWRMPISI